MKYFAFTQCLIIICISYCWASKETYDVSRFDWSKVITCLREGIEDINLNEVEKCPRNIYNKRSVLLNLIFFMVSIIIRILHGLLIQYNLKTIYLPENDIKRCKIFTSHELRSMICISYGYRKRLKIFTLHENVKNVIRFFFSNHNVSPDLQFKRTTIIDLLDLFL